MVGVGCAVLAGPLAGGLPATAQAPAGETVWLCHPDRGSDPCSESLETTVQHRDGSSTVVDPPLARNPRVDCFYVYPTVSDQPTRNADRSVDPQIEAIARLQANRFARRCAVYAPVYRQVTVPTLLTGSTAEQADGLRHAYVDVRAAWLDYWRNHNRGRRPFVLVGHSQGAGMLTELIRDLIDDRRRMRERMLSAIVPGVLPTVPVRKRVGGDFRHVPTCTRRRQIGCVMGWATYGDTPPDDARYGVPSERFTEAFGWADRPGLEAICTNPARLQPARQAEGGRLRLLIRTEPFPGSVGLAILYLFDFQPPFATTPWVQPPDRYRARCVRENQAHVLKAEPIGDSRELRPSPSESWGLHLVDLNLALPNLNRILRAQLRRFR
jgi:hypothetical protein